MKSRRSANQPAESPPPGVASTANGPEPAEAARMLDLVYEQLHHLAAAYMSRERPDHTLQPTALVHEAYLRLLDQTGPYWRDPRQFRALAASAMRHILVDHARRHRAAKRGGPSQRVSLEDAQAAAPDRDIELLALDEALERLNALDKRQGRVVELRFFGGMTNEEAAEVLGVSRATVANDWTAARAWLSREIREHRRL